MLYGCCGRIIKVPSRMALLKTIRRQINFWDKGKAEENIHYLKEQREKLRKMRQQMAEIEGSLDENIKALEELAKDDNEAERNSGVKAKESPKKRD